MHDNAFTYFSFLTLRIAGVFILAGILVILAAWINGNEKVNSGRMERIGLRIILIGGILLLVSATLCSIRPS